MVESIPLIGGAISAAGSIGGAAIGSSAASDAAQAQLEGTKLGIEANKEALSTARKDTSALRDLTASTTHGIAGELGYSTGAYEDTASGYSLPAVEATGVSKDPYKDPNRKTYTQMAQPYVDELKGYKDKAVGIMDRFTAPYDEKTGQPVWYKNALAGFKQSPGYDFTKTEGLRQFNQSAAGNIMGGGRLLGGTKLASGYAAADYDKYRDSVTNAILADAKTGLAATQESADLLGTGLSWESTAQSNEETSYSNYFNRLLSAAGLGSAATTKTAELGVTSGSDAAKLYQNLGTTTAKGITDSANALSTGLTSLTSGSGALSKSSIESYLSSDYTGTGSSSDKNYYGSSDYYSNADLGGFY